MSELKLSAIQQRVLTILQNEQKAISAYALLEKVKPYGLQSPVQIYRILKKTPTLARSPRFISLNDSNYKYMI